MGPPNAQELALKYAELKARLPIAAARATEDDAHLSRWLSIVAAVRKVVFEKLKANQPIAQSEVFIAGYGEEILRTAASSSHNEWMTLSQEVASLLDQVLNAN